LLRNSLIIITLLCPGLTYAQNGWVDDWITQHTETSPGYFEGQKRGYWTAGSFSGRWQTSNDALWSVSAPKIKSGCGGIDVFLGGIDLLEFQYMVQKLQNILQVAPAAAFDIALKTLCEPCASTIKTLEYMSSQLNQIQIDDCKASKAMVATIASPFVSDESKQAKLADIQADFVQSSGIDTLWQSVKKASAANNDNPAVDLKQTLKGCPKEVMAVFGASGSVIDNLARQIGFNDTVYTDLLRGLLGDINIVSASTSFKVVFIPPCDKNQRLTIDDFLNGRGTARNDSGQCYSIKDKNKNLILWVSKKMQSIATKDKNRSPLNANDAGFVNALPFPAFTIIKTALGTQQESSTLTTVSDLTARAYAYRILADLYAKAYNILEKGKTLSAAQSGAAPGSPAHQCRIDMMWDAMAGIEQMQNEAFLLANSARDSYATAAQEANSTLAFIQKYTEFDQMAGEQLTETFGPDVADRAMEE
jgi:conjugative transfer pilus assembly protein TraH